MEIAFDISEDELPIFLAEVDEHLLALDDILIRLEREDADPELVQTVFRSAHTIKGMAGMIGHRRMTDLTHALETALDGVRKGSIQISPRLINLCLEAVDLLRLLRDEVVNGQANDVAIDGIVAALKGFTAEEKEDLPKDRSLSEPNLDSRIETVKAVGTPGKSAPTLKIRAKIDTNSMASAARAFQLLQILQDVGEIQSLDPTQTQIETAAAVSDFAAVVVTSLPLEKISDRLTKISGVDEISINGTLILSNGLIPTTPTPKLAPEPSQPEPVEGSLAHSAPASDPKNVPGERRSSPFGRRSTDMTIRANVERLNNLMNLVGELITDRNRLKQIHGRLTRLNGNYDRIAETITHLGRITDQLQEEVMHIRMLPISSVFGKFPRMVHDMSRKVDKLIDVVIQGEETEMDRSMLEEVNDPLIHLIRNAVDHGIELPCERLAAGKSERGTITMTARHEQGRILVTVEDDGGGIDGEKLRRSAIQKGLVSPEEAASLTDDQSIDLMFLPGLSTSEKVTDISGRGVGLDIVITNLQRVSGSIQVETQLGRGTRFQIVLPLTLAIVPALMVQVNQTTFAIPLVMITETLRLESADIQYVYQKPVTLLRGSVLSLIQLSGIFNLPQCEEPGKYHFAVVVQTGKQRVGLIVDSLLGEDDVIVKPLGAFIGDIAGISSAAILGDGQVALIVDVFGLFKLAGI
jgi:two-component system, chemotaxis family, sensor kinase CheA